MDSRVRGTLNASGEEGPPFYVVMPAADFFELLESHAAEVKRNFAEAFAYGVEYGDAQGAERVDRAVDAWWARLSRGIRRTADRLSGPVPEPRDRPRHDDSIWFTPEEWRRLTTGGDDAPASAPGRVLTMERRAAA